MGSQGQKSVRRVHVHATRGARVGWARGKHRSSTRAACARRSEYGRDRACTDRSPPRRRQVCGHAMQGVGLGSGRGARAGESVRWRGADRVA